MKLHISKKNPDEYSCDISIFFIRQSEEKKKKIACEKSIFADVNRAYTSGDFVGREGQTLLLYRDSVPSSGKSKVSRILAVGLGKEDVGEEMFRKAGGTVASTVLRTKARRIQIVLPEIPDFDRSLMAQALTEGLVLGAYQFRKYKTKDDDNGEKPGTIDDVAFHVPGESGDVRKGMVRGQITGKCVCDARDMSNEPGNFWTPDHFVMYGRKIAKMHDLKCTILTKEKMKALGMGGILGVNQGSAQPPAMVVLEYNCGRKKAPTLLLVGKGLTFDSGGISLKPGQGMEEMKYDMSGGAAVMAVMDAIGTIRPANINVVAIVPATENLPGPTALKPGDIISQYGGKTVEVINTDAEGRLILADALAYGAKKYKPKMIVDLATLTGAVIIGLGHHRTGLLGNDDELAEKIISAGERCGEPLWRLPLAPEYRKQLNSKVADMKNVDKRDAGTITAAAFLEEFVEKIPWAHLDIAGTAWDFTEKPYIPKGPSGVGVRTLIEFLREWE